MGILYIFFITITNRRRKNKSLSPRMNNNAKFIKISFKVLLILFILTDLKKKTTFQLKKVFSNHILINLIAD